MYTESVFPECGLDVLDKKVTFWNLTKEDLAPVLTAVAACGIDDPLGLCGELGDVVEDVDFAVILCEERCEEVAKQNNLDPELIYPVVLFHELGHLVGRVCFGDDSEDFADDFAWDMCEELGYEPIGLNIERNDRPENKEDEASN